MNLNAILDRAKAHTGSDAATARALGIGKTAISNWRTSRTAPENTHCARLAELTGLPLETVIAAAEHHRARDQASRRFWLSWLQRRNR